MDSAFHWQCLLRAKEEGKGRVTASPGYGVRQTGDWVSSQRITAPLSSLTWASKQGMSLSFIFLKKPQNMCHTHLTDL